jgi:hypothetical protein
MSESDRPNRFELPDDLQISSLEANYWWRKTDPVGAFLNNLMFAFIVAPVVLVLRSYYVLSFVIFALMVPYGFLLRWLAVAAVRRRLAKHPEDMLEFREAGIIL